MFLNLLLMFCKNLFRCKKSLCYLIDIIYYALKLILILKTVDILSNEPLFIEQLVRFAMVPFILESL